MKVEKCYDVKVKKKIGGETMKVIQLSTIVINGIVEIEIRLYIN